MASDLESLNNALETQAANDGISINLSSPTNFTITPDNLSTGTGNATNIAATSITANVKTAMPGYSLSISTNTDNSNLTNTDSTLANTQNGSNIPSTTGTQANPTSLTTNTWGYAMKRDSNNQYTTKFDTTYTTGNTNSLTSKWAKVPTSQTPETIKHTEDTPQASGDNTVVYYGVNVPKNKTAGQYQTTITYTATTNVLDPPEVGKVSPDTIRQGLSMVTGTVPSSYDMQPGSPFTCYVSAVRDGVYCAIPESGYNAETTAIAPDGLITGGRGSWYEVNTSGMSGNVIQMVTGTAPSTYSGQPGNEYTCYVTDIGRVYCSIAWDANDTELSAIAPDGLITGGRGSWYEVNTSGMSGNVIQMVTGTAPSTYSGWDNPDGRYTCYLTSNGSVYCSVAGYNIDTKSIAPSLSGSTGGKEWQKVNLAGFDSSVSYVSTGTVGSSYSGWDNPDGSYTCYITTNGSTYCSISGYNLDTSSIAPSISSSSLSSGTWSKVSFNGVSGRVVSVSSGRLGSSYMDGESGYFSCYSTQDSSVYCAMSGYNIDTSSIAPDGQMSTSGQWHTIEYFKGSAVGATITLTGSKLSKVTGVYVDSNKNGQLDTSTDAQCTNLSIKSDSELTCTAPQLSPGTYNLFVVNASNQTMVPNALTYQ